MDQTQAATIEVADDGSANQKFVLIRGQIVSGDLERTKIAAKKAFQGGGNPLTLVLDSPGGDVEEAMLIGRFARDMLASTVVRGNVLYSKDSPEAARAIQRQQKLPDTRSRDRFIPAGAKLTETDIVRCYSACVFILFGGPDRVVWDNIDERGGLIRGKDFPIIPVIGLHRPYYAQEKFGALSADQAKRAYVELDQKIRAYLTEMGAPQALSDRMFRKASNEIDLVGAEDFKAYYQPTEPFLKEWQLAKCAQASKASDLTASERADYETFTAALSSAIHKNLIKSDEQFDNFTPPGMTLARVKELQAKVQSNGLDKMACHRRAIWLHQLSKLGLD